MTTLISEMTGLKPRRDDPAPSVRSGLMMSRAKSGEGLTAKLLVAQQSGADQVDSETRDLLIQGLVERLPKPNGIWSLDDRAKWLRTAASVFDLVYQAGDGDYREIRIALARQEPVRTT